MAMTLAEIKRRLTVGTVFYCTQNVRGPIDPPAYRKVIIQQTNAIACAVGPEESRAKLSWLHWPKASGIREIPGGFEVDPINPDNPKLRYQWEAKATQ
jgi:hypothetical protein